MAKGRGREERGGDAWNRGAEENLRNFCGTILSIDPVQLYSGVVVALTRRREITRGIYLYSQEIVEINRLFVWPGRSFVCRPSPDFARRRKEREEERPRRRESGFEDGKKGDELEGRREKFIRSTRFITARVGQPVQKYPMKRGRRVIKIVIIRG